MSDHVYKVNEVVGSSASGVDAAIANAISRIGKTVRNLDWFEVAEIRGHIAQNSVAHTQVTLKVGFRIDPAD